MSKATKLKHLAKELKEDPPESLSDTQLIAQIIESRGNNLHLVLDSFGEEYLASMPMKFRRNIWVKRGDYVVIDKIDEGAKVKAEIVKILVKDHIKFYKSQNCWPERFSNKNENDWKKNLENDIEGDDTENNDDLFVNPNRQRYRQKSGTSESSSSSSDNSDSSDSD